MNFCYKPLLLTNCLMRSRLTKTCARYISSRSTTIMAEQFSFCPHPLFLLNRWQIKPFNQIIQRTCRIMGQDSQIPYKLILLNPLKHKQRVKMRVIWVPDKTGRQGCCVTVPTGRQHLSEKSVC